MLPAVDAGPPPAALQPTQQTVATTVSTPDPSRLADVQTPAVMVEKRSAAPTRSGEPRAFQLVVRNLGTVIAPQVTVEDDVPTGAQLVQADPSPEVHGARARWVLHDLAAGGMRVLSFAIQGGPVDWPHNPRVHVSAASRPGTPLEMVRATPAPAPAPAPAPLPPPATPSATLTLQMVAPPSAMTGRPAVFAITFANPGKLRLTGLVLRASSPMDYAIRKAKTSRRRSAISLPASAKRSRSP